MTTLNTIIEEEKKEFDKQYGGQRFVYANELTMQDFLATSMQRAALAMVEEIEKKIPSERVDSREESFRRSDKATEWGYNVCRKDILTHLDQLKKEIKG